mmetsp:Transcript_4725/g.13610  ORF Transcript_4725/g.13610 Transcript_4725/m.13610 type:complete len:207 (+) Transcript_4725:1819-2439(+)
MQIGVHKVVHNQHVQHGTRTDPGELGVVPVTPITPPLHIPADVLPRLVGLHQHAGRDQWEQGPGKVDLVLLPKVPGEHPKILALAAEINLFPQRPRKLLHTLLQHHDPIRKRSAEQTELAQLPQTINHRQHQLKVTLNRPSHPRMPHFHRDHRPLPKRTGVGLRRGQTSPLGRKHRPVHLRHAPTRQGLPVKLREQHLHREPKLCL